MSLSERIRPNSEAAPWVVDEVIALEQELADAYLEIRKIRCAIKAIFDRDVWDRAEKAGGLEMSTQVYLNLINGFHIKVTPLKWVWLRDSQLPPRPQVLVRVEESAHGYVVGEQTQSSERYLFCIAGYSRVSGKIKAVAPDLSHLEKLEDL